MVKLTSLATDIVASILDDDLPAIRDHTFRFLGRFAAAVGGAAGDGEMRAVKIGYPQRSLIGRRNAFGIGW